MLFTLLEDNILKSWRYESELVANIAGTIFQEYEFFKHWESAGTTSERAAFVRLDRRFHAPLSLVGFIDVSLTSADCDFPLANGKQYTVDLDVVKIQPVSELNFLGLAPTVCFRTSVSPAIL